MCIADLACGIEEFGLVRKLVRYSIRKLPRECQVDLKSVLKKEVGCSSCSAGLSNELGG